MLFRPFAAMVFSHPGGAFWTEGVAGAGAATAAGGNRRKKQLKSILFYGFQYSYIKEFEAKIIFFYGFQKLH